MIEKIKKQKDYELIDSGDGQKLERYGSYTMSRPDPEALWKKKKNIKFWQDADLTFTRTGSRSKWNIKKDVQSDWTIDYGNFKFSIKPTSFKHIGLFPEQLANWQWIESVIEKNKSKYNRPIKIINLFAYTGGATIASSFDYTEVCHVDGSKTAVAWARLNAELSGLKESKIRWIVDDVILFLEREIKRGNKYDAIIMDPPSFGHGPKDELWKIEEHFIKLMDLCKKVLSDEPLFVLINGYTAGYSAIAYENNLQDMMENNKGKIEIGELAIEESDSKRLLPCGIFARWERI